MHPTLQHDLMQARQQDKLRSAARKRLAARARPARQTRADGAAVEPPRGRVRRLVWRLLPV